MAAEPISGKLTEIGSPIAGALEFMRTLSDRAEITILTSRLATTGTTLRERQEAIETWLAEAFAAALKDVDSLTNPS